MCVFRTALHNRSETLFATQHLLFTFGKIAVKPPNGLPAALELPVLGRPPGEKEKEKGKTEGKGSFSPSLSPAHLSLWSSSPPRIPPSSASTSRSSASYTRPTHVLHASQLAFYKRARSARGSTYSP